MAVTVEISKDFGYVLLVLVFYTFVNLWMVFHVGKARKKFNVFYPTMYALESENKDAKLFNCVQRGHQNSLETMPVFFATLLASGVKYPCVAASLGLVYTIGRIFYFKGYSTGVPENRYKIGGIYLLGMFGLMICSASFGISLLLSS